MISLKKGFLAPILDIWGTYYQPSCLCSEKKHWTFKTLGSPCYNMMADFFFLLCSSFTALKMPGRDGKRKSLTGAARANPSANLSSLPQPQGSRAPPHHLSPSLDPWSQLFVGKHFTNRSPKKSHYPIISNLLGWEWLHTFIMVIMALG